jgi:hypothetical protein
MLLLFLLGLSLPVNNLCLETIENSFKIFYYYECYLIFSPSAESLLKDVLIKECVLYGLNDTIYNKLEYFENKIFRRCQPFKPSPSPEPLNASLIADLEL